VAPYRAGRLAIDSDGTGLDRRRRSCGHRRLSKEGQKMPRTINLSHLVALVRIGDDGEIRTKIYVSRSANEQRQRVADAFQTTCPRYGIESRIAVLPGGNLC